MKRVLLATVMALGPWPALACSCAPPEQTANLPPPDAVVDATVEAVHLGGGDQPQNRVSLAVHNSSAGNVSGRALVRTPASSAACGVDFKVGQRLRIAMMRSGDGYVTNLCIMMRTAR